MARIHRRTVKKDLHDPDNHDGVITHLEPDILECEVKWALESITMNKASGGDRISVELCQSAILNMPAKMENTAVATGLEKVRFSFQSPRKAMPKNVRTTTQLHLSHTLAKKNAQSSPSQASTVPSTEPRNSRC